MLLPRLYDALDVDVLHVQLPFHGSRNPKSALFHGEFFWSADLVRSFEAVRQSCIDARTLVAWLRARATTEVGVTGISLGGSITMVLACVDPTPDYIVPIVSHLHLAEAVEDAPILWRMKADLERFGVGPRAAQGDLPAARARDADAEAPARAAAVDHGAGRRVHRGAARRSAVGTRGASRPSSGSRGGHMTFPLSLGRIVERTREFHETLSSTRR